MTDPDALPRRFAPLGWSNLAAQSAEQIALAALPIVAVLMLGAGPGAVGLLSAAATLPFLLLSVPLGLAADRGSRRALMAGAEGVRALSLLGLGAATASGAVSLPLLALLGFVGATGTVGFSVAAPALVPALVPRRLLAVANGRLELARSAAFAAGPALAGALVAWTGASAAFALAATLSLLAGVALLRIDEPARTAPMTRHLRVDLREGAALVWQHAWLRPILLTAVVWNIAWFVLQAAYVPYAMRQLGLDAAGVGLTLGCYGVGMVCGALLAARVLRVLPYGGAVLLGPLTSVAAIAVMLATLAWPSGALAAVSFFLFGVGPILWTITATTLRQHVTPGAMLGRVSAIFLTANAGARPLGAALGAWIGATQGPAGCLLAAAVGFVLQAWLISASPLRTLRALPAAAA